jgi:hypothetical protein
MSKTIKKFIAVVLVCITSFSGVWAQARPAEQQLDTAPERLKRSIASYDSLVKELSNPEYWKAESSAQVKPGDKKDGGVVYWVDGTGKHGLIVYGKDVGIMKWERAVQSCKDLGPGWHLSTKDELDKLYRARLDIVASYFFFQSSTEAEDGRVWLQSLKSGEQKLAYKNHDASTCAVKNF